MKALFAVCSQDRKCERKIGEVVEAVEKPMEVKLEAE
jgi:hypothetical protein